MNHTDWTEIGMVGVFLYMQGKVWWGYSYICKGRYGGGILIYVREGMVGVFLYM